MLANPRTSATQIRAIAAELPTIGLEDALAILLAFLDREPQTFSRGAARWGGRFTVERKLSLVDAQLALAALAALPGPGARAGAEALIELSGRYGLRRVDELLVDWMRRRGGSASSAASMRSASRAVSAAVCSSTSRLAFSAHDARYGMLLALVSSPTV